MIVTLIETYRIFNMTLPDKVKGRFWITDVDSFGNDRKLISVEADEESWVLKGSDSAVICDTHNPTGKTNNTTANPSNRAGNNSTGYTWKGWGDSGYAVF